MRALTIFCVLSTAWLTMAAAPPPRKPAAATPRHATAPARPSAAAPSAPALKGDPYSVTVPVDATAASASVAQTLAINGGQARAWDQVSHRLIPQKDWARLPKLDATALQRLVRGYTVAGEKRSTTRYTAEVTYIFNPGAVRHLFRVSNITFEDQGGTAILVVAMSPSYNAHSAWAQAFAQSKFSTMPYPLVSPIGDAVDQSALGPLRLVDASWGAVEPSASRVHANEAILVDATSPASGQMTVRMRRIGPGKPFAIPDLVIPIAAGTPPQNAYATAADQAAAAIEDTWKLRTSIDFGRKSKLVAEVRIVSLEQWSDLLAKLSAVPIISDVSVQAMNTGEARIAISYSGTADQVRDLAAQSNIVVASRDGMWWVSPGKAAPQASSDE